jgi:hypothetical protein
MAKETKTADELRGMIMKAAKATGKCGDLQGVQILGPIPRPYSNWDVSTDSGHPTAPLSGPCSIELRMIVTGLQGQFDLSGS